MQYTPELNLPASIDYLPGQAAPIAREPKSSWLIGIALAVVLCVTYGLLLNPYWVRHGDSEVFISTARSIARGQGFRFNGQPLSTVPPGWPIVLAGALKITTRLLLLKLIPMASLLGFLLISYALLCRLTTPLIAALCVLASAMLDPIFSLSTMFFSDPLFALLSWLALWQAVRIGEGSTPWWRIALVVVLNAAATSVRWNGTLWWLVLAGAMVSGSRPRVDRKWVAAFACGLATLLVFLGLRFGMRVDPSRIDPRYDAFLSGQYGIFDDENMSTSLATRAYHSGQWITGLLVRPIMQAQITREASNLVGWGLICVMFISVIAAARRGQLLLLAVMIHLAVLFARWTNPLPRYILLLAPLLVWMIYDGLTRLFYLLPARWSPVRTTLFNMFFATVFFVNSVLYVSDLMVMRHRHFYDRVEGGTQKELIDAAWFINQIPKNTPPFEIAISPRRVNFEHVYNTAGYFRALNFLTDRSIISVPSDPDLNLCREPDADVVKWMTAHNVRFYLYQPPIWVFEEYAPLSRGGVPINRADIAWRLYEIIGNEAHRVMLESTDNWPRNVPGM